MIAGGGASISVHTPGGAAVAEFSVESLTELSWNRKRRDVSQCDITVTDVVALQPMLKNVHPWHHWVSVWEYDSLVWTGPIQVADLGRDTFSISARDVATFTGRTRVPFVRRWAGQSTAAMAAELFQAMLDLRRLDHVQMRLFERPDQVEYTYDLAADTRTMNTVLDDLVKMGLDWSVVAGTIVSGKIPAGTAVSLDEEDILSEIRFRRDGSQMTTDVRVQGQNYAVHETVPGPVLQSVVNLDNLRGVGNIRAAAKEYVAQTGRVLESVVIPSGASLAPDAPVTFDNLVPGNQFHVFAQDRSVAVELTEMKAVLGENGYDIQVTLDSPPLTSIFDEGGSQ